MDLIQLKEMANEIDIYRELIITTTNDLSYKANDHFTHMDLVLRLDCLGMELMMLLELYVQEVDEFKKDNDSNVINLEIERKYRFAQECLNKIP